MAARGAKGRNGKFDSQIKIRLDNRHNIKISQRLDEEKLEFSRIVRACMIEGKDKFDKKPELLGVFLARMIEEGFDGDTIERVSKCTDLFKKSFVIFCLNKGFDLNEYVQVVLYLYQSMFCDHPWLASFVYSEWEKDNCPRDIPQANDSPKQSSMNGIPDGIRGKNKGS